MSKFLRNIPNKHIYTKQVYTSTTVSDVFIDFDFKEDDFLLNWNWNQSDKRYISVNI